MIEKATQLAQRVQKADEKYLSLKLEFEKVKAEYCLITNWEEILGKSRPTMAEKDSYIKLHTMDLEKQVNEAKIEKSYARRLYEIGLLELKLKLSTQ